jgi:N-acetyldiaminopimelate deacetylase
LEKITGGTVQNIIAEKARLEGTIRTLSPESMDKVKKRIKNIVSGIETGFECRASIDFGSNYYEVNNHGDLTSEFMAFARNETNADVIECKEAMTGEDFGYMLKEIPGFMFWLGVQSPFGLHHSKINPDEDAIEFAIKTIAKYLTYKGNQ